MLRHFVLGASLCVALSSQLVFAVPGDDGVESSGASGLPPVSSSIHGIVPDDLLAYLDVSPYVEQGRYAEALSAMQSEQSLHENDPSYFNLLGILALKAGNHAVAVAAFERVVLMQPDNAGAWLDLAIASVDMGNLSAANSYFDYIEAQFNPPPSVRVVISRYRARIASGPEVSTWQLQFDAMAGVDSNANSGLQNSAIPLTFGADRVDLMLDPSFRARSDRFLQVGANANYKRRLGNDVGELAVSVRTREYATERSYSTLGANLSAGLHHATYAGDVSTWLHLGHLWLGGSPLLHNIRAVAQLERPYESCRLGLSGEVEWRRYSTLNTLDANLVWGQAGVACDWKLGGMPFQTILIGRSGIDHPVGTRAGGQTRHDELIAQLGLPIIRGAQTELSMSLAKARDKEGYSPLLEQNAPRTLNRRTLRLQVTLPVNASADLQFLAEDNRYRSNLLLFDQSGQTIGVGFRYRF